MLKERIVMRTPRLPPIIGLMLMAACAWAAVPGIPVEESGLPAAEWKAIRAVIDAQRTALRKEDGARAMSYATRGLKVQFGTPEIFMQMVHQGYQPLLDARYAEFLDGAVIGSVPVQPLRLILPDNTVLVALYQMEMEDDGHWHIAGCTLAPSTVKAARTFGIPGS